MALPPPVFETRRRFYSEVEVAAAEGGGFAVRLDGRTLTNPAGPPLVLPTPALARLVADEWASQGERIEAAAMPATRLAFTALADGARDATVARLEGFAGADLLCYFVEGPAALAERQDRRWAPVIAWAEGALGVEFRRSLGIVHQPQPPQTLARVRALAEAEPDFALAGLGAVAALFGSAILAFALRRGALSAEAAFELSRLDEIFQEERWGLDAEAQGRAEAMAREAVLLERWFAALSLPPGPSS